MKALSIRQPWAWLILHGGKDIENRNWLTKHRGPFLIHASLGMTHMEYIEACDFAMDINSELDIPLFHELQRGGIVGYAELDDVVLNYPSPWFVGDWGFVLSHQIELPLIQLKGALGFFDVKL